MNQKHASSFTLKLSRLIEVLVYLERDLIQKIIVLYFVFYLPRF